MNHSRFSFLSCFCCFIILGIFSVSAQSYTGYIRAKTKDGKDKALSNICVSNGREVVKTDRSGKFVLPEYDGARFVFITMPSGYKAEKHYLPIREETESYDFALELYEFGNKGGYEFMQITDTEIFNTVDNDVWTDDVRKFAGNEKLAFIIHTGDICYEKGLKEHIGLINSGNTSCPVYYAIGNHDLVKGRNGEALFEEIYGPVYYSFDAGDIHYVVTPMLNGDYKPGYTKEQVYHWLKNDLAHVPSSKSIVMFSHDLLTQGDKFDYGADNENKVELDKHNLLAWVYGHWHVNMVKRQGKVLTVCTSSTDKGGIDHSVGAMRVFKANAGKKGAEKLSLELRFPYIKESLVINSVAEEERFALWNTPVPLSVNAYDSTSPVQKITGVLKEGQRVVAKSNLTKRSVWNWTGRFSLDKQASESEVLTWEVTALLKDGRTMTQSSDFLTKRAGVTIKEGKTDWNNLGGNAAHNSGMSGMAESDGIRPVWLGSLGAQVFMTSPLIDKNGIYIATVDEDAKGEAAVFSMDVHSGKIKWKCPVRSSVKSTIAGDDLHVYAQDIEGNLYAISKNSGKIVWEKKLHNHAVPPLDDGLATEGGLVFAGAGKSLGSYEGKTGKPVWTNTEWGMKEGTPATVAVGEKIVIGSAQWAALYGHDKETGALLWTLNKDGLRHRASSGTFVTGDELYILSEKRLFLIDALKGEIKKSKEVGANVDVTSSPLITDDLIIFGTADKGLAALDRKTWETRWTFKTGRSLVFSAPYTRQDSATIEGSPLYAGGKIWITASDGCLYGLNPSSGEKEWSFSAGAPFFNSPALWGNLLVVADYGGSVYAFILQKEDRNLVE